MDFRVSHAQNREDILIAAFFPDVEAGHYVDVGAGHPSELSVTKLLYDRGWSGINVEPIPELAELLRAERPRDHTVQAALASSPGQATFRQYTGLGLSTLDPATMAEHETRPTEWNREYFEYVIETSTLTDVLEQHPLPHIHLLKLDVEGSEYDVLVGNDWERFRPDLVCIETNHVRADWQSLLREVGYEQVFHDGLNAYLLSPEAQHRAEHFDYTEVVLGRAPIVTPDEAAELEAAVGLRRTVAEQEAKIDALTTTVAELDATATDLSHALTAESELRTMYAERHAEVTNRLATTETYLAEILGSTSWRLTFPIRRTIEILRTRLPRRLLVGLWRRLRARSRSRASAAVESPPISPHAADVLDRMRDLE
jgi:FkbM family methyltransferase